MEVDKEPSMELARQDDFHDSITVARPRVPERDVFGSCANCNAYLFTELNRWKRVNADYVMHIQRQSATSNIEGSMIKGEDELDGSNELEGCKIVYLRCADCSHRLGLHCSQGTKTKRFSNTAMLRVKKIVLRDIKSTHQETHQVRFNIVGDVVSAAEVADGKTLENKQTENPSIDLASIADMMPIREKKDSNVAAATAAAQNATGIESGTASESCKVCKDKHMRCDKRWPTCITCETFGRKCHWLPDVTIVASQPPSQASSKAVTKSASPAGPLAATTTTTTTTTAAKKEPARGSWKQRSNLSPVDCGTCRMWHRDCDRSLPKCKFCIHNNRTCNYHGVKLNAIDQLDPKPVLNPNANLPIIGGGTDDEGDDEDDDIMPIRPRSRQSPASISAFEYEKLRKTVTDQKATMEELEISYHSLLAKFATYKAETRSELKTLKKRQHTMEKALQKVISNFVSDPGQLAATQNQKPSAFKGPVTTVPNRQIALAKRGGHRSPSSHKTFSTGVTPAKRLFDDHVMSTPNGKPLDSLNTFGGPSDSGRKDNRDVTGDAHPDFNSLYDATPPPRSTMMEEEDQNMSDVNVPSSEQIQNNRLQTQADVSSSSSLRSQPIPNAVKIEDGSSSDASSEAETQAYLKRTVRDEDSEDEDFNPAGESIGPSQNTGPDTQLVAESVDRLLSPSRPLRATPKTRGSPGRPRGSSRGRGRPAKSPVTPHDGFEPFENISQSNFVPSTPSTGADSARTSVKRRGFSGASRPVPTEFSHSAFSSSQAATMINDEPTPKRVKFGGTPVSYASVHSPKSAGGPVSFAFKPPSGEKVSSRYPEGRIRDAEGYLLNKNGTRDRRSVRGKLLGFDAFRKQEDGGRRTVDSILTQRANGAAPAVSSPLAQQSTVASPLRGSGGGSFSNQQQYHGQAPLATTLSNEIPATPSGPSFLPINMQTPASMLTSSNQDNGAHFSNGGGNNNNNNGQQADVSSDQQDDDALATSRDVAMLAAEAERDRVARAHAKGDNREWSNKHAAIWEKMGM